MTIAIYAGSFDPFTNGHLDILKRSLDLAQHVVVAVGMHPSKKNMLTAEERVRLITELGGSVLKDEAKRFRVVCFDNLLIDKAHQLKASMIIRGLRDGTDLDYEMQLAGMNASLAPDVQTVFLPASTAFRSITSTLVRQVALMGGDVSSFVPENVAIALKDKAQL